MTDAPAAQTEYAIYLFDFPMARQKGDARWSRHATLFDERLALEEAKKLYKSRKYQKIEVKKKFYNSRRAKMMDITLKVFQRNTFRTIFYKALSCFAGS